MSNPLEIGKIIYDGVAVLMDKQTANFKYFIESGAEMSEEEKTARILEIVNENLQVLWPLFLIASANKK